jgi:hypothetical protein
MPVMSKSPGFWHQCAALAYRGSSSFANDWQWIFGVPAVSGVGGYLAALRGGAEITTGYAVLDGIIAAFIAFVIRWIVAFVFRVLKAASTLYYSDKTRGDVFAEIIAPKLQIVYDENISSCCCITDFADGTKSKIFRLQVENRGTSIATFCQGWLHSIAELPLLSAARLFWVGMPEEGAVDLIKGIPRFLQIIRIHETNKVVPATFAVPHCEVWPIDQAFAFVAGQQYHFRIGVKANDRAETEFSTIILNWTGNWTTATVEYVAG